MPQSQQQLDDLLERLIALTDQCDAADQRDSLARLSLLLIEAVDDAARVRAAVDEVLAARGEPAPCTSPDPRRPRHDAAYRFPAPAAACPSIQGLHHFAWRCRDAEETRRFYEDILGLPLVHVVKEERVPSTGEHCPFVHLFFEFADHSHIAFFDLGDNALSQPDPATPRWVNHFAMEIRGEAELERMRQRLLAHGVEVVGPTDHHFIRSIYFFDPNGIRLELTARLPVADYVARKRRSAHEELAAWNRDKAAGLKPGATGTTSHARHHGGAD